MRVSHYCAWPLKTIMFLAACLFVALALCSCAPGQESAAENEGDGAGIMDLAAGIYDRSAPVMSQQMTQAQAVVQRLVEGYGDKVAVAVVPLDGSAGFSINGDQQFVSASMIKLLVMAEYVAQVDAGTIDSQAVYTRNSADMVGGTGQIQSEGKSSYTYDQLVRYMLMHSDNVATNVLIDVLGMDKINARAQTLGLSQTNLQRKMMQLDSGVENHISANDAASLLLGVAQHTLGSEEICSKMESYLQEQTDNQGLAQGLPEGVAFGHKTGTLTGIRHDGGIVYAERQPYVIVVLTSLGSDGDSVMAKVSKAVYSELCS